MLNLMFVLLLWMSTSTVLLFFSFYSAFLLIFSACIWKVRKTNQYGKGPPAPFNLNCGREWREIATYMKGSFKYAWKKHCGSESLEGQVLTRPFSAVHGVPLWTHGLLLHSSVSRQIHRAEACPKKEALYQGMTLSFQHHWPWRWGRSRELDWDSPRSLRVPNAELCLLLPGFSSVLSGYCSLISIP